MNKLSLTLALLALGGCASRDVSRAMERDAMKAAFESQLRSAENAERKADFWRGMTPIDGVVMAGEEPRMKAVEEPRAVVVETSASDLEEPEEVAGPEATAAVTAAVVVTEVEEAPPPVVPDQTPVEVIPQSKPPPDVVVLAPKPEPEPEPEPEKSEAEQSETKPAEVKPAEDKPAVNALDAAVAPGRPVGTGLRPSESTLAVMGASGSSSNRELTRAVDDLRWTMTMEARLEDKQRLIDMLSHRMDASDAALLKPSDSRATGLGTVEARRLDALAAAQQAMSVTLAESKAAATKAAEADKLAAAAKAEAEKAAEAKRLADEQAKIAADMAAAEEITKREAALATMQARLDALESAEGAKAADPMAVSSTTKTTKSTTSGPSPETASALAAMQARLDAMQREQTRLEDELRNDRKNDRRDWRFWKKSNRRTEPAPEPKAAPVPAPVQPVVIDNSAETEALRVKLAESEASRMAAEKSAADSLAAVQSRLSAFEASNTRMAALQAELAASGEDKERLAQVEAAMASLEGDRAKLAGLQGTVAELAAERKRLEEELVQADAAQKERLEAERAASDARAEELNAELKTLRERQLEMEKKYTHRQEAILARLQPLIDSGLAVRLVDGNIKVDLPSDVLFKSGSSTLNPAGAAEIKKVASALEPFSTLKVQVQGHTDNVPIKGAKSNWDLAYARSNAVLQVLLQANMPASRTSAASFGDTRPVAANDTAAGREKNRRIELSLELPPLQETP